MASLTGKFASLNPFTRSHKHDDDKGDEIDEATIGGGGYSARAADVTKHNLAVSRALKSFLVDQDLLGAHDVQDEDEDAHSPALLRLLEQPHAILPAALTDRSFRLTEYFISSSHNTYLKAHQLFGHSAADAYAVALSTGSRCVEIDAWDNDDNAEEPKVTHGYTLVSNVSLRAVCETIREVIDKEATAALDETSTVHPSPIVVSLENHCGAHGQLRIVEIMTEVLGHRLLAEPLPSDDPDEHVTLAELGAKVVVMVEHHIPGEPEDSDSSESSDSSDSSDDEAEKESELKAHEEYKQKKKTAAAATSTIVPELAAIGVYAQSVKPSNNSWFEPPGELTDRPHHHLINVSESGLAAHLTEPANSAAIARHNARHLMRVFPKGTRISSRNLNPVPFWAAGAQVAALNWQRFDATMQLNEALFHGSDGYVLKPAALRSGGSYNLSTGQKVRLRLHVAGAAGIPLSDGLSSDLDKVRPYLTCSLVHSDDLGTPPAERKRKTNVYKQGGLKGLLTGDKESPPTDPLWDEVLEWEYEDNELVFLRLLVKNDESWSTNSKFAVAAVRLAYVQPGWRFIRMLDLKGRETTCSLLVKFEVEKI